MNSTIQTLPPFTRFIATIGQLPSSYLVSMTYEEQLLWLCNYLENTVIPTLNNNGEVVEELQNLFIKLKNYVDNYFDNLDVQQEINNKLDEMAESGELEEIIGQYLRLAGIIVFNTVADMKSDGNLIEGSTCQTLGYYQINDGGKGIYKIRNIINTDIIDNGSIISLENENLVAELIINNSINFKQFGAKGDGITNDYQTIKNCCDYANTNNILINNLNGNYYIDGNQIQLNVSVKNSDEVTFILGNSYQNYNSLFAFEHDETIDVTNVLLSTVFSDKNTLTDEYKGKSFLLDTKIAYGERLDGTDPDETIVEPFYCNSQYERLWYGDYDGTITVDVKNISNSNEKGYYFIGGNIRQKDSTGDGTSFLKVARNNCVIKNLNINCENTNGHNAVINVDNGNNVIIDNIYCGTIYSTWGYDISLNNVSNVKSSNISNIKNGHAFGNRTLKNWILTDSNIYTWDIHWNAFGFLIIDNSIIESTIQIGYGTGILSVRNSYVLWLETRQDYMQIFNGEIIIDNCYFNDGVRIRSTYSEDSTRDTFFDDFKLPNIVIRNSIRKYSANLQDLAINIPAEVASMISTRGRILFDNFSFRRIYYVQKDSATTKIYDSIVRDCDYFTSTVRETLEALGTFVGVGSNRTTDVSTDITPSAVFNNDFTGKCKKCANVVSVKCEGTLGTTVSGSTMALGTLPEGFRPNEYAYGIINYDGNISPCYINSAGSIRSTTAISSGNKIVITVQYIQT